MQDPARSLQELSKILAKTYQDLNRILARSWQDPQPGGPDRKINIHVMLEIVFHFAEEFDSFVPREEVYNQVYQSHCHFLKPAQKERK